MQHFSCACYKCIYKEKFVKPKLQNSSNDQTSQGNEEFSNDQFQNIVLSACLVAPAGQLLNWMEPYPMRPNLAATSLIEAYSRKWHRPIEDVYFFMQFVWSQSDFNYVLDRAPKTLSCLLVKKGSYSLFYSIPFS